jgi:glycosyltransferase involved in cell wall biosynthesis
VHYSIVGDGPLREHITRRIEELGLSQHVTQYGKTDNAEVASHLVGADVVVFPSTAESSSIACAEAMGMGKMVVASRVGGLVELIGRKNERGLLVELVPWEESNYDAPMSLPVEKYQALAEGILRGLERTEENETRKNNAYTYASVELSWGAITKKTLQVYRGLCK